MQSVDFNTFVAQIGAAVGTAQNLAAEQYQGRVERMRQLDGEGRTEVLTWWYTISGPGQESGTDQAVRLPILALRPHLQTTISEFDIEFDGVIESPAATGIDRCQDTRIKIRRSDGLWRFWPWPGLVPWRRRFQKILIRLRGQQPGECQVFADGEPVEHLSD